MTMLTLYQFAISHYCEKARWALAFKNLQYTRKNLLPGPHIAQLRRLGVTTSATPLLDHDGKLIQGSDAIISYLDETFAQYPLTPDDEEQRAQCLEWEDYLDREVGIHVRRYCYHYMLQDPSLVVPLFTHGGPWYGRLLYKVIFSKLRAKMRHYMKINEDTALQSKQRFEAALERIDNHLQDHDFLVGDRFTRADLSAAALFAPLVQPRKYGIEWPTDLPAGLQDTIQENLPRLRWVEATYEQYR